MPLSCRQPRCDQYRSVGDFSYGVPACLNRWPARTTISARLAAGAVCPRSGGRKQTIEPKRGLASPAGARVAEVDAKPAGGSPLAGGHLLAAISTSIVGILREHY